MYLAKLTRTRQSLEMADLQGGGSNRYLCVFLDSIF